MYLKNQKVARTVGMGRGWREQYHEVIESIRDHIAKEAMKRTLNFIQTVSESHWRGLRSDLAFSKIALALVWLVDKKGYGIIRSSFNSPGKKLLRCQWWS